MRKKTVLIGVFCAFLVLIGVFAWWRSQSPVVEIRDNAPWFFPAVLEIEPGTVVSWKLKSPAVHPVMQLEGPVEFHSGHFTDIWQYQFNKPGVYVYICPIHPYMKGVIGVGQKVPPEKIPAWVKNPLESKTPPLGIPSERGVGRVWVDAQFHEIAGKEKPGSIIIINAETWQVEKVISDSRINNPHNLIEFNGKILQTNWFDKFLSVINKQTGEIEQHLLMGESPAHVMPRPQNDKVYVTIQGDDALAVLDSQLNILKKIRVPKGPHGHGLSEDGLRMAIASTEKGKISVWDTQKDEIIFEAFLGGEEEESTDERAEEHVHSLPLMAGITKDGRFAFAATSGTGRFFVFDVDAKQKVAEFAIGPSPIQVVLSPNGEQVWVPLTGSGEVAVVSTDSWRIVTKIVNVGRGAHAVAFGPKKNGNGFWGFVSNKFETWVTVVDAESLQVAGYVPLPEKAFGGQGIIVTD